MLFVIYALPIVIKAPAASSSTRSSTRRRPPKVPPPKHQHSALAADHQCWYHEAPGTELVVGDRRYRFPYRARELRSSSRRLVTGTATEGSLWGRSRAGWWSSAWWSLGPPGHVCASDLAVTINTITFLSKNVTQRPSARLLKERKEGLGSFDA